VIQENPKIGKKKKIGNGKSGFINGMVQFLFIMKSFPIF